MIAFDHLVIAGPDLQELVELMLDRTGVRSVPGGPHPGLGTTNELIGIGPSTYVELIGPDRAQPSPDDPRPFGIDHLKKPTLVTWAVAVDDIDTATASVAEAGLDPGVAFPMSRVRPDGISLNWKLAIPPSKELGGVMPFLICWDSGTPHPAASLPPTLRVADFSLSHPKPLLIRTAVEAATGSGVEVVDGDPGLSVVLAGPRGNVTF